MNVYNTVRMCVMRHVCNEAVGEPGWSGWVISPAVVELCRTGGGRGSGG